MGPTSFKTAFPLERLSKLTLGTAQLGMDYGIANRHGCPDEDQARAILESAWNSGITCIDTARVYGTAEERIGAWQRGTNRAPLIITKLPSLEGYAEPEIADTVTRHVENSCRALGVASLDGYLVHRADDLRQPGLVEALRTLRDKGKITAFGVSAYTTVDVERALAVEGVTLVQLPLNVLDHAMIASPVLSRCLSAGVLVFARSVFCQGAIFLDPAALPHYLEPARPVLTRLKIIADEAGYDLATLALTIVRDLAGVASIVIGVDSVDQVIANARAIVAPPVDQGLLEEVKQLGKPLPRSFLDPSQWPRAPLGEREAHIPGTTRGLSR